MDRYYLQFEQYTLPVYTFNTVVVGSGAAGFNAADMLAAFGQRDIAIVSEDVQAGTSRNTGSDKQTYYKLTLAGSEADSVVDIANTLFAGECMDGDIALCEASLSAQCFLRLVSLGVPFPQDRYGAFTGYKTDHDPRRRATSAGPYTSRLMTEALEHSVRTKSICIFDRLQVISILKRGESACGLLCWDASKACNSGDAFVLFNCTNIIYAVGGPAGIYADSVYPAGHFGASGVAFEAGVRSQNLTEWQFGLASIQPKWNVSGSYMQVLPRFYSTNANGGDEREFLWDAYATQAEALTDVFLKGYQWPFDVRKVAAGSSRIDLLVYREMLQERRVFLDYRSNPGGAINYSSLAEEAYNYLQSAGACYGNPVERLAHMNQPALNHYLAHGVDLTQQPLEIALCVQHNNGGLQVDAWWQTSLHGLFAAGEVAGTHGVYRPGGSALNSGQVGGMRAAAYIAARRHHSPLSVEEFNTVCGQYLPDFVQLTQEVLHDGEDNVGKQWQIASHRMSRVGGAVRERGHILQALAQTSHDLKSFCRDVRVSSTANLSTVFRLRDMLQCQQVYLAAMADYVEHGGGSRGSALYVRDVPMHSLPKLGDDFLLDAGLHKNWIQETWLEDGTPRFRWRKVRPIPQEDDFFENVWRSYRENSNIY